VAPGIKEFAEARGGVLDRIGASDADHIKAFALAIGNEEGFRGRRIADQKSRSA
jgi:hypothetical protein